MTISHVLYDLTITIVWNNAKANSLDDALGSDSSEMEVELLISLIQRACGLVYLTVYPIIHILKALIYRKNQLKDREMYLCLSTA